MDFYIVATPIGNLNDLSARAIGILEDTPVVVAEDTEKAKNIFSRFSIPVEEKQFISFNEGSSKDKAEFILEKSKQKGGAVYISEAGTPAISDPGPYLVEKAREEIDDINIIPLPGPSAVTAALSVSGFEANKFGFWGFVPKKEKKDFFNKAKNSGLSPAVFFDSKHRIIDSLKQAKEVFGEDTQAFIAREISKVYEDYYRGTLEEVTDKIKNNPLKGEFTIILDHDN